MIRLLIRLPLVLVVALSGAWAWTLLSVDDPDAILGGALADLGKAFPSREDRAALVERASLRSSSVGSRIPDVGERKTQLVRAGLLASALHFESALRLLPASVLLLFAGISAGLVLRERMRDAAGYASPTAAGLASLGIGAGILWMALYSLSPVPVSHAWLYASVVGISLGGALYVANLPLRL